MTVFWPWTLTCVMDVWTHYDMCVNWLWLSSVLKFSPAWWTSELITICVDIGCDCLLFVSSHLRDGRQNSLQCVCTASVNVLGDVWGTALTCVMNVIRTLYRVHTRRPNETKLICVYIGCDCLLFVSSHLRDGRQLNTICVYTVFSRLCGDVVRTLYCVCTQETSSFTCVEI